MTQCGKSGYLSDMPGRTTMNISLTPELTAFLQKRVKSGRYQTTSEVVREALRLLEREENERTQILRGLKAKLDEAAGQAARGDLVDGDQAFDGLRRDIVERRRSRAKRHLA